MSDAESPTSTRTTTFPRARGALSPLLETAFLVVVGCGVLATAQVLALHVSGGYAVLREDTTLENMVAARRTEWAMLLAGPLLVLLGGGRVVMRGTAKEPRG